LPAWIASSRVAQWTTFFALIFAADSGSAE
jgi:hypothetical protein